MKLGLVLAMAAMLGCGGPRAVDAPAPPAIDAAPVDALLADDDADDDDAAAAAAGWSAADVAADLATLRATLDAIHPGLDRYLTPAELDQAFAAAVAELGPRASTGAVFVALARLTARLGCGHTHPNPYNQPDAVRAAVLDGPRLPFGFRWLDDGMVIAAAFVADPRLAPGTRVTAIDGVPVAELRARLLPLGRTDGGNRAKRLASLEVHGGARYEAFDVYLPLVAPEIVPPYQLALLAPDGGAASVTVDAMTAEARLAAAPADPSDDPAAPLWRLAWLDARTAYLRMPTWVAYRTTWDWRGDLDRALAAVARRRGARLIVDLRGNEGGSDVGDRILAHAIARPIAARTTERWVRYRRVPDALRPPLDTWDPTFFDWGDDAIAGAEPAWFRLADEPGAATIAPAAPRLRGKLIVLVDASNSSATFQFAQQVQRHHLGTLVGEPTGGNQRGINGGAFFFLRLPRTGVEIDVPIIGAYPPGRVIAGVPDAGLVPDVVVPTTAADLAAGRDPQLAAARGL